MNGSSVWQLTPPTGVVADLALTLSDSPDPVFGTTPLTYTLAVSNAGPSAATSLSVFLTLPSGAAFSSAAGPGWTCGESGGVVTCTRPTLSVGAAPDITVQVTPGPAATVLTSLARVSATETDPNLANNSDTEATTVNAPLVWIGRRTKTMVADSGELAPNANVTYTLTLTNTGSATQADNPGHELVDALPATVTLVSASATSGTATTDLPANTVTWDGSLPSGGSVTISIHATIRPTVALGTTIANQATVYYDADCNGSNEATTPTDDPAAPGANDPSSFIVGSIWTTRGPYGATVRALAMDPANPATLYVGTYSGGVFKSTTSGGTWTAANTGLTEWRVQTLAIDPASPATLYAGTYSGGVFKSTDSGGTWASANTGLASLRVDALVIDPTSPTTLYAASGGVYRSTNSGGTWTAANTGLTCGSQVLAINPSSPATLYAGGSGGVCKSTDSGATWTPVNNGLTNLYVMALAVDPVTPSTLYAGTRDGVYKSTDSGGTWAGAITGSSNYMTYMLAIDRTSPSTVYAGTESGLYKSTNSGGTWAVTGPGGIPRALAIDPTASATLYAGIDDGRGVFKSTNGGGTWTAASEGLTNLEIWAVAVSPSTPATVYAGIETGVFKSTNSGGTWARGNLWAPVFTLAVDPTTPATVYAGTDNGVKRSTNSGDTWAPTGLKFTYVYALAIDPTTPTTLYAGTDSGEVFKSTNSGATWTAASTGLPTIPEIRALAIDPMTPTTLYAGKDYGDGVFKSTDSGSTWAAANTGLTSLYVCALAIDPTSPATLYAGTWGGVFKSTNSGGTWAETSLRYSNVCALAIDPTTPGTLYAGTDTGVFKSTDSGGTWVSVNKGLPGLSVSALAIGSTNPATVYAGTTTAGVWQATAPVRGDSDLTITLSDSPDPVNATTPLTYTISVANGGPDVARSVSVSHTLPSGVTFGSASSSSSDWYCSRSSAIVTCTRPSLPVGAAPDIGVRVTPGSAATVLSSLATVSAAENDPNPADNTDTETTTVVAAPFVSIGTRTKTVLADSGEFLTGTAVTYTITLTNTGTATQADNSGHELVDALPSTLALVSADATTGSVVADLLGNSVAWDGSLPSGSSVTVTVHATIQPTLALGTAIANQATVYYDADGNGTNEATTLTDDPDKPGANDLTSFVVVSPPTDFYTLTPCRLLDTRDATGTFGGPALAAGGDRVLPLFGRCDIPTTARAVSVNLTVTQPTAQGNLRLYPAGTPLPLVSAINYVAGQTRANNAIAPLNGLGELAIRCSQASGTAHFILDVNGYFE